MLKNYQRPARRALLVEDSTPLRTLFGSVLAAAGFEVTSCASAHEALKEFGR